MRAHHLLAWACLGLVGCSDDAVTPPASDTGVVTFRMTTTIPSGSEVEHCKFVQAPAEGILLNRDEVRFTEGSHHVLLFDTAYEEIPTTTTSGAPLAYIDAEQGVFDCSEGVQFSFQTLGFIAGSQNYSGESIIDFPPHVAMTIPPGRVMLMNAHYINTTPDELHPDIEIDLHTIDASAHEVEGDVLFFFDVFIKVPALGDAETTLRCDIPHDITVTNAQSHMHARGVDYQASAVDAGGERRALYASSSWENIPVSHFEEGFAIAGGSHIEQTCRYQNGESRDIFMGPRTTDEMCVFIGSYYPAEKHVSLCSGREEAPYDTFFFGAEWVGQGSASCADSLSCFQTAATTGGGGPFDIVRRLTECVKDADPSVSAEFSRAVGCSMSAFMSGENPTQVCTDAFVACLAK